MSAGESLAATHCTFRSQCLGIVIKDEARNDIPDEIQQSNAGPPPVANVRDCVFERSHWGGFFGSNLSEEDKRALMAVNTFRHNGESDLTDHYPDRGAAVQPWRRGALSR